MPAIARTLRFTLFLLLEYLRSGRFLVEIAVVIATYAIFFRSGERSLDGDYFFTISAVVMPLLMIYTASACIGLVDRPQTYLLLARRLQRGNLLCGLLCAAVAIVGSAFLLLSLVTALTQPTFAADPLGWLSGSLPLLLNLLLIGALMILISALVLPVGWRLSILALIALALSSNFISGPLLASLPAQAVAILNAVQALLGGPLVPVIFGYQLSVTRELLSPTAIANMLAQISLSISFLSLAIYALTRRDLLLSQ